MPEENRFIARAVELVRRGDFIAAASDPTLMANLQTICDNGLSTKDYEWLRSSALLAEVRDQTGQYSRAGELFSDSKLRAIRRSLRQENDENNLSGPPSDDVRRMLRAEALYILQAAIHKLRRFELDAASEMMAECVGILKDISSKKRVGFHSALSLFHYWQGRVELARNQLTDALRHFQDSMRQTEENLEFHFSEGKLNVPADNERIAYATYALSSCMAFGVAHTHHMSGRLKQALDLLRPASAMLMATGDNYRRGYAMMLIGAAERALAGPDEIRLKSAIAILEEALKLFGFGLKEETIQHHLHQARAHHQLAIAFVYLAQAYKEPSQKAGPLRKATHHTTLAGEVLTQYEELGFGDKELKYDLFITNSRILREQKNYDKSCTAATAALEVTGCGYAPSFSKAKAFVARAETALAQYDHQKVNPGLLTRAETDLAEAMNTCDSNLAIAAVTRLYSARILLMRGEIDKARLKFHDAWDSREKLIQNGWVRDLAKKVQDDVGRPVSEFTLDFARLAEELDELKQAGKSCQTFWRTATTDLQRGMIEWAQRTEPRHPWVLLGIGQATYYEHLGQCQPRTSRH